jgi:hypothetical protein
MHYTLNIAHPGQPVQSVELLDGSYTIGRGDACKIRLRYPEISERHALLAVRGGRAVIEDLNSSNGVMVNGVLIEAPKTLSNDSVITVGPCLLRVSAPESAAPPDEPAAAAPRRESAPPMPRAAEPPPTALRQPALPQSDSAAQPDPMLTVTRQIKNQIHQELVQRLDLNFWRTRLSRRSWSTGRIRFMSNAADGWS